MDCKLLGIGSRLYLPVETAGALLSFGDAHARQGDGEISGTAIECPMDNVELRCTLHHDLPITRPRARTTEGELTLGFGDTIELAVQEAMAEMLDWKQQQYPERSREQLLALGSAVADVRLTQIVNPVKGAHVLWPSGPVGGGG